jgi:hypothetical protein
MGCCLGSFPIDDLKKNLTVTDLNSPEIASESYYGAINKYY